MMDSIQNNQGTDDASEAATIHGTPSTPHDVDGDPGDEVDMPSSLSTRAPLTERVTNKIKTTDDVQLPSRHSPTFDKNNQHILFQMSFWNELITRCLFPIDLVLREIEMKKSIDHLRVFLTWARGAPTQHSSSS